MRNERCFLKMLLITVILFLYGCQSQQVQVTPQPPAKTFDINFNIDPSIEKESITIDAFTIASNYLNFYKTMTCSDYFNKERNKLTQIKVQLPVQKDKPTEMPYVCTILYKQGMPVKYTLSHKDLQWNAWKYYSEEYLVIFTDLNSEIDPVIKRGPLIIPLYKNCWKTGTFLSAFPMYQNVLNINLNFQGISYSPSSLCVIQ